MCGAMRAMMVILDVAVGPGTPTVALPAPGPAGEAASAAAPHVAAGHHVRGLDRGPRVDVDAASRRNCACVQASGVAENVGSPGAERRLPPAAAAGGPTPARPSGGWRRRPPGPWCRGSPGRRRARRRGAYSPRSPASSGQPRPSVLPEPVGIGSHWVPSGFSPYPSKLARCQNGPLAVGYAELPSTTVSELTDRPGRRRA